MLDPVAAYDLIAPQFGRISALRRNYLARVEALIRAEIPNAARSLLDVGAGDGSRSMRIAKSRGISRLVLAEPSAAMRERMPDDAEKLPLRAEELEAVDDRFDVVLCLWNVLGHVVTPALREGAMRQFARLSRGGGTVFLDVSHRYNARHYGLAKTAGRYLKDLVLRDERTGDVVASWDAGGRECSTYGHVFTDSEVRRLAEQAGLEVRKRFAIDYASGEVQPSIYSGHLLYELSARTT